MPQLEFKLDPVFDLLFSMLHKETKMQKTCQLHTHFFLIIWLASL